MAQVFYTLTFEGSQEVPARTTAAFGTGLVIFDTITNTASYVFQISGIDFGSATTATDDNVTGAHFHAQAARGQNTGVVFDILNQDNDDRQIVNTGGNTWRISGRWEPSDPATTSINNFAAIFAGGTVRSDIPIYANIHTNEFTGGEIRAQLVGFRPPPHRDFNGDNMADVLWQNDNGTVHTWLMNGAATLATADIGFADASWNIRGTGDFGGDGLSDILWQNDNGTVDIWHLNGSSVIDSGPIGFADSSWHIRATGEFNDDSDSGILWQNDNGTVHIWGITGNAVTFSGDIGSADASWHIRGTGDFGGDGRDDILWQNDNGAVEIWHISGVDPAVLTTGTVGFADAAWHIRGTDDFGGDGMADILWQHDNGTVHIWQISGSSLLSSGNVGFADAGWNIRDFGDFSGDGKADILWQHDSGRVDIWQMDGLTVLSTSQVGFADATWNIIPPDNTGSTTDGSAPSAFGFGDLSDDAASGGDVFDGPAALASSSGASLLWTGNDPLYLVDHH